MNSGLLAFVRQQLAADNNWALAAGSNEDGPDRLLNWEWVVGDQWEPAHLDPMLDEYVGDGGVRLASREEWPSRYGPLQATASGYVEELRTGAAGHILRHDPAKVLKYVEGTCRLLDWLETLANPFPDMADSMLRQVALRYDEEPGYREEWAPQ